MALVEAAWRGNIEKVKEELDKGTDPNQKDNAEQTGLHWAAGLGYTDIVEVLCERGADPNSRDHKDNQPLHQAAYAGYSECVVALARAGAHIDIENNSKVTPLYDAAIRNKSSTVELLLALGADPRHRSIKEALKEAREEGYTKVIEILESAIKQGRVKPTKEEKLSIIEKYIKVTFTRHNVEDIRTTPKQRGNLSRTKSLDIMSAGRQRFGKTTIVKTLTASKPCLTKESDRTVVANFSLWVPGGKKTQTIVVVDLGGHDSYRITGHYFHINSTNQLVLLCHDLTVADYDETLEWIDLIWCTSPDSNILILLTKADLVEESEQNQKKEAFFAKLGEFVKEQLEMIKRSVQNDRIDGDEDYRKNMDLVRQKYEELLENKESHTHIVSCVDGYEESVEAVKSHILKFADKKQIQLPEELHLLFERLGKVGLDVPQIRLTDERDTLARKSLWQRFPNPLKALSMKIKTAKKSKRGTTHESHTASKTQADPSTTPADRPSIEKTQYATLDQAVKIYKEILELLNLPIEVIEDQTKDAVSQLSKQRLLIYFPDNERLSKIIFNDLKSFTNILRCVFHHTLDTFLEYDSEDEYIKQHYPVNPKIQFKNDVAQLKQEGLITQQLVGYLLSKHNCGIDASTVLDLLNRVDVGTKFHPKGDENEPVTFMPFFVSQKDVSEVDLEVFQDIEYSDKDHLSMTLVLHGNIKKSYWYYLVVQLHQRTYLHRGRQKRQVFRNGFYVTIGKYNAKVALTMPEKKRIKFVVKACIKDEGGHKLIFSFLKDFNKDANAGKKKWWRGLPEIQILLCSHCEMELEIEKILGRSTDRTPVEWCALEIFKPGMEDVEHIYCQDKQIPAGLIHPLSEDESLRRLQLHGLQKHLREHSDNVKAAESLARADSRAPKPVVASRPPAEAPGVPLTPVAPGPSDDIQAPVVSQAPESPVPLVRPKQAVICNEILSRYGFNHKLFNKDGFFQPQVSDQCCLAIANATLQDRKFALSRVCHHIVALPEFIVGSEEKEQINAGTTTLHQVMREQDKPQKLRHLLVFLFHHHLTLYREMEVIHEKYTRKHVKKCTQCNEILLEEKPREQTKSVGPSQSPSIIQSKSLHNVEGPGLQVIEEGEDEDRPECDPLLKSEEPLRQPHEASQVPGRVPQFQDQPGRFSAHPPGQPPDVHVKQMLATLSDQIFIQGKVQDQRMKEMKEKIKEELSEVKKVVRLEAGDVSKVDVVLKHKVLQDHKDVLIQNMDASDELVVSLISEGILAENTKITDTNDQGRAKRILLYIQDSDDEGVCKFISVLKNCTQGGANYVLGEMLRNAYDIWNEKGC